MPSNIYQSEFTGEQMDARFAAVAELQSAVTALETAVAAKYAKPADGIPSTDMDAAVQNALAKALTAVQSLADYYTKSETDALLAAIAASVNATAGVTAASLPTASASTVGKMYYIGPDGNGEYARYVTAYDGTNYSWLAVGTTDIDLTQYATKAEVSQLDQKVDLEIHGEAEVTKDFQWADGYVTSPGKINSSTTSKYCQPILFKAGEKLSYKTGSVYNYGVVSTEDGTPLAVGDSGFVVAVLINASTADREYTYVFQQDTYVVITVQKASNTLSVKAFRDNSIDENIAEKLDKVMGPNLVNLTAPGYQTSKYITTSGSISSGTDNYSVSDYIPTNGKSIISNAASLSYAASYAVYNGNKALLRTIVQNTQYTYQEGDAFVRIGFVNPTGNTPRANYGTTLAPYEPYTEFAPLSELENRVDALEPVAAEIVNKLDKIPGDNLVNPNTLLLGAALSKNSTTGAPSTGYADIYKVTDYIPVDGKDIIATNPYHDSYWATMFIYDVDKNFLRNNGDLEQYTYQSGDAYVRISYQTNNPLMANYGTTAKAYKPYTEYEPLGELALRVDAIDGGPKTDLSLVQMDALYAVYNSVNPARNYAPEIDVAHFINTASALNTGVFFDNGARSKMIPPSSVVSKSQADTTAQIKPKDHYNDASLSFKLRLTNSAASKSVFPKVLVIGDSVTNGYGAGSNKPKDHLPNIYWAYVKMFYELDKIDGGDNANENNVLLLGGQSGTVFYIDYAGGSRQLKAHAVGKGGATLDELLTSEWGGDGTPNPFYDGTTFSVADYIAKYRTMDDAGVRLVTASANPAGETVTGSDGLSYTVGSEITSQTLLGNYDVCTPTHIVLNMVQNTSLANFQSTIGTIIDIIQDELPGVPVIIMVIDETGTYFPVDFPDYIASQITFASLHTKNLSIYDYVNKNVKDEANGVYVLGANFVQPTAEGYPTIKYSTAAYAEKDSDKGLNITNPAVTGTNYHPNNNAHEAWGYALYSMLKYLTTS